LTVRGTPGVGLQGILERGCHTRGHISPCLCTRYSSLILSTFSCLFFAFCRLLRVICCLLSAVHALQIKRFQCGGWQLAGVRRVK
jgi:hypothetical protein